MHADVCLCNVGAGCWGWHNDCIAGEGAYTWRTGRVYVGRWVAGKEDGIGTKQWMKNGNSYAGSWKAGAQHGKDLL